MTVEHTAAADLRAKGRSERREALEALVAAEIRTSLLMPDDEELPVDESFFELGLTSLGLQDVRQRLETALGCRLTSTDLFNNPTVLQLVEHLATVALADLFAPAGR